MPTQDFSDSGALYQNHLNCITQRILKHFKYPSDDISFLGKRHDISSILAQNAAEEGVTGQESPTSDEQHISRACSDHVETVDRIVTGTTAVGRGRKAAGKKHAGNRKGKVKASLHRTHKMKLRKDTILPSKDSGGEIGGSAQKQRE